MTSPDRSEIAYQPSERLTAPTGAFESFSAVEGGKLGNSKTLRFITFNTDEESPDILKIIVRRSMEKGGGIFHPDLTNLV